MSSAMPAPDDEFNRELLRHAHPPEWKNPAPRAKYHMAAIGGGTAGIISALATAGLGGNAALIERHLLGGDCLNYGCVPSKALIRAARAAYEVSRAADFGVRVEGEVRVDFGEVMRRMRRLRSHISHHDSAERFTSLGVDVFLGEARFTSSDRVQVTGHELRFTRCVIATGGRAAHPAIEGLEQVGFLTNETVFSLTELPSRLIVLGGGPIGCELAQAFRRFGSRVTLIQRRPRILPRDEPDASAVVTQQFEREGIDVLVNAAVVRAQRSATGKRLVVRRGGEETACEADEILVAAGRTPNVEGLDLDAAGVSYNERGIVVDDRLRSTNPRIFAAGDVAGSYQFTHAADAMARACVQNAFFFGRKKLSRLLVPHTTYTDPEVAHVGLTAAEAEKRGIAIDTYRENLSGVDRAILDGDEEGFAVVHCRKGTGRIVGATIVGRHAGDMIGEMAVMMSSGLKLGALAGVIHCYPTQVEVLKRIGDQFQRGRLTPRVARLLKFILTSRR